MLPDISTRKYVFIGDFNVCLVEISQRKLVFKERKKKNKLRGPFDIGHRSEREREIEERN